MDSKLTKKWARAMLSQGFGKTFEVVSERNEATSCDVVLNAQSVFGEKCGVKDHMKVLFTDSSEYIQIRMPKGKHNMNGAAKDLVRMVHDYYNEIQEGRVPAAVPEAISDIVANLPLDGESAWWQEIKTVKTEVSSAAAARGAMGDSSTTKVVKAFCPKVLPSEASDLLYMEAVTSSAMMVWETMKDWPTAQSSIVEMLVAHGAQVQVRGDTIVKRELDDF